MDPDLFTRPDGRPMVFVMSPLGAERQKVETSFVFVTKFLQVKAAVEAGGGYVLCQPPVGPSCAVRLLARNEICLRKEEDMFLAKYVLDCVRENRVLPNLKDYRIRFWSRSLCILQRPPGATAGAPRAPATPWRCCWA